MVRADPAVAGQPRGGVRPVRDRDHLLRRGRGPGAGQLASTTASGAACGPATCPGPTGWRGRSARAWSGSTATSGSARARRSAGSATPATAARWASRRCTATPTQVGLGQRRRRPARLVPALMLHAAALLRLRRAARPGGVRRRRGRAPGRGGRPPWGQAGAGHRRQAGRRRPGGAARRPLGGQLHRRPAARPGRGGRQGGGRGRRGRRRLPGRAWGAGRPPAWPRRSPWSTRPRSWPSPPPTPAPR